MIIDLISGFLLAILVSFIFNTEPSIWFVLFGAFSVVAPDIDFLIYLYRNKLKVDEFAHEHRDLLHNPVLFIPIGGSVTHLLLGFEWTILFVVCSLAHFIHDTFEDGWGVRWLYPFSKKYLTFNSASPKKVIESKEEQRKIAEKYGDSDWLGKQTHSKRLVLEIMILLVVVAIIFAWLA